MFPPNWIAVLFEQISLIEKTNKNWGVLGTFGVAKNGMFAGHLIDPSGHFHCLPLSAEVQSFDEHCLITRKDRALRFDEELSGFHFYGADICLEAMAKGMTNYAVDVCVEHLSLGKVDDSFITAVDGLYRKWRHKNPPLPVIQTTCKMCRLQGGLIGIVAYRLARFERNRRRKKIKELIKNGLDYRTLRHDII
jgi:hypothetical protein